MRRSDIELEEIASKFRSDLGMSDRKYIDLMTVLVKMKGLRPPFNYRRVPDSDMKSEYAQFNSLTRELVMRESVFSAMQGGDFRARFTIAEEISHCVLGHSGIRNRSTHVRAFELTPAIRSEEMEARRFAAILLAPERLISRDSTPRDLMEQFGISEQAALFRIEEIERLDRHRSRKERKLPQQVIDFLNEAKSRGFEIRTKLD